MRNQVQSSRSRRIFLWKAERAARGVLERRNCVTWGMWQIHWAMMEHYNKKHAMRWPRLKVLGRGRL